MVNALTRPPNVSATISVSPSIAMPFGNQRPSAATCTLPSGSTRTRVVLVRVGAVHQVEAEVAGVGAALGVDEHVVQRAAAVLAQVGVGGDRPVDRAAQDPVVLHRDHQQRVVRQEAEPGRLVLDLDDRGLGPVRVDRVDGVAVEIRRPPAAVVPARPLEEGPALDERAQLSLSHRPDPILERMRLSVLDQSPISEGSTGSQALQNTIDLARLADALGYTRYWVAEHHGGPMLAGPSPEALIGPIAAATSSIRVGSGGVMLPHYSPFKVAETFSVLVGPVPGPDRPRAGPRGGHRPDDHARAAARPHAGAARRLPAATGRAARLLRGHDPGVEPARAAAEGAPGAPGDPRRRGCSAPRRRARSGPPSSVSPTRSRTSSTPRARRSPRSTGASSGRACGARTRSRPVRRVRRSPPTSTEEAERLASELADGVRDAAQGPPDRGPAPRQGDRASCEREGDAVPRRRAILGTPDEVRAGIEASRPSTAPKR